MANYLASNFRHLRDSKKLSQEEMAKELFNNDQRVKISNLETERSKKYVIEDIKAYADYFGYTIDDLVNKDLRIPDFNDDIEPNIREKSSVIDFPVYKEKNFRKISNIAYSRILFFAILILIFYVISMFKIFDEDTRNAVFGFATSVCIGYMVYIFISSIIEVKKNVERIFLLQQKNFYYLNDKKFSMLSYIGNNILIGVFLLFSFSIASLTIKEESIYIISILYIINFLFIIACISLSFKRKLKKSDTISYTFYFYEKIKYFFSVLMTMFVTIIISVNSQDKIYTILGLAFSIISYFLIVKSYIKVNSFYQNYTFEIK